MFDFHMIAVVPLRCAEAAHHVKHIQNYEWWVKPRLIWLVIPVYTTAAHVCTLFSPLRSLRCRGVLTESAYSRTPTWNPQLFLLFFTFYSIGVAHFFLRKRLFKSFVSIINKVRCHMFSRCKQSSCAHMFAAESSLAKNFVKLVWICC